MTPKEQIGIIIKNYNGYYYVQTDDAVIPCKIRGRLKKDRYSVLTGDKVVITLPEQQGEGSIEKVLPRKNRLLKPAVANVDQIILVFALQDPEFKQNVLDRFLVSAQQSGVPIVICFSKYDLAGEDEFAQVFELYEKIGYQVIRLSSKDGLGLEEVKSLVRGKTTVFAGLSGAGKSSLLNAICPALALKTGSVSDKNSKGRHTTRFSQLLFSGEGYIIDTPGYSFTELIELSAGEIEQAFPEFNQYKGECRFLGCTHSAEPVCGVKQAVQAGEIDEVRYNNYLTLIKESKEAQERKFK